MLRIRILPIAAICRNNSFLVSWTDASHGKQDKGIAEDAKNAAKDVTDGAKNAVEDAEEAFRNQANKAVSQKGVVEGTVTEPLSKGKPATDPNNAW